MRFFLVLAVLVTQDVTVPRFRSGVDAVRVDVLVIDGGRAVTGLAAADFEVRDTDVVQRVEAVSVDDTPVSAMFALDTSGSVKGEPLRHLREAATTALKSLRGGDRAALLTFSHELALRSGWTSSSAELSHAIAAAEASGGTALYDAAYAALTRRDEAGRRTLVLIFSDGDDTASWLPGQAVISVARRTDAVVYAVRVDSESTGTRAWFRLQPRSGFQAPVPSIPPALFFEPFLEALAEETGGRLFEARTTAQLADAFTRILTEFRTRYLLTYTPRGVDTAGWHSIEVKLKNRKGQVTARRGYNR
jgi:Ca-activated chloride channel family protein